MWSCVPEQNALFWCAGLPVNWNYSVGFSYPLFELKLQVYLNGTVQCCVEIAVRPVLGSRTSVIAFWCHLMCFDGVKGCEKFSFSPIVCWPIAGHGYWCASVPVCTSPFCLPLEQTSRLPNAAIVGVPNSVCHSLFDCFLGAPAETLLISGLEVLFVLYVEACGLNIHTWYLLLRSAWT